MLNFKIGQFYKDTDGDDWIFEGYKHTPSYSYFFRRLKDSFNETFFKDEDNSVTREVTLGVHDPCEESIEEILARKEKENGSEA